MPCRICLLILILRGSSTPMQNAARFCLAACRFLLKKGQRYTLYTIASSSWSCRMLNGPVMSSLSLWPRDKRLFRFKTHQNTRESFRRAREFSSCFCDLVRFLIHNLRDRWQKNLATVLVLELSALAHNLSIWRRVLDIETYMSYKKCLYWLVNRDPTPNKPGFFSDT